MLNFNLCLKLTIEAIGSQTMVVQKSITPTSFKGAPLFSRPSPIKKHFFRPYIALFLFLVKQLQNNLALWLSNICAALVHKSRLPD